MKNLFGKALDAYKSGYLCKGGTCEDCVFVGLGKSIKDCNDDTFRAAIDACLEDNIKRMCSDIIIRTGERDLSIIKEIIMLTDDKKFREIIIDIFDAHI